MLSSCVNSESRCRGASESAVDAVPLCFVSQFSDKAARRRAFHVLPSAAYAAAVMEGINVSRKLAKQAELETEADELGLTSKQRADRLRQHKYVGGPST